MKFLKKSLLLLVLGITCLAGCGQSQNPSGSESAPESESTEPVWVDYVHNGEVKLGYD